MLSGLYVPAGHGRATVGGRTVELEPGTLLVIERGEPHEVPGAEGERPETLNPYVPPAC